MLLAFLLFFGNFRVLGFRRIVDRKFSRKSCLPKMAKIYNVCFPRSIQFDEKFTFSILMHQELLINWPTSWWQAFSFAWMFCLPPATTFICWNYIPLLYVRGLPCLTSHPNRSRNGTEIFFFNRVPHFMAGLIKLDCCQLCSMQITIKCMQN